MMRLDRLERKQQQILGFPFAAGGRRFGKGKNRMSLDRRHHPTGDLIQLYPIKKDDIKNDHGDYLKEKMYTCTTCRYRIKRLKKKNDYYSLPAAVNKIWTCRLFSLFS